MPVKWHARAERGANIKRVRKKIISEIWHHEKFEKRQKCEPGHEKLRARTQSTSMFH